MTTLTQSELDLWRRRAHATMKDGISFWLQIPAETLLALLDHIAQLTEENALSRAKIEKMICEKEGAVCIENYYDLLKEFGIPCVTHTPGCDYFISPFDALVGWKREAESRIAQLTAGLDEAMADNDDCHFEIAGKDTRIAELEAENKTLNIALDMAVEDQNRTNEYLDKKQALIAELEAHASAQQSDDRLLMSAMYSGSKQLHDFDVHPSARTEGARVMTEEQIKHLVDRFLQWRLPKDFNPDAGISYARPNYAPEVDATPSGTNLLDATQATDMVRFMVEGLPASSPKPR